MAYVMARLIEMFEMAVGRRPQLMSRTHNMHRIRIDLPDGIEFELAEIGSASTRASGALALELKDTYGQFNRFHLSGNGIVRGRTATARWPRWGVVDGSVYPRHAQH